MKFGASKNAEAAAAEELTKANGTAAEPAIGVRVPPTPLLDTAIAMTRSNPGWCVTFLSLVMTAMVFGLCFVVVAIPPLFLDDWTGKRIYVGMMVPLITLLCTVLNYYVMQHPQRMQNTMMVNMVKEMEQHSTYLSIAVTNVEKELTSRGVNVAAVAGTSFVGGQQRSALATPDNQSLSRTPGGAGGIASSSSPNSVLRGGSSGQAVNGTNFLRGIDKLDEDEMVIATVHVGKEWKWFNGMLRKLKTTTMSGPSYPGLAHQRAMVRLLSTAIARVEKLILSLYFSSFVLQHLNVLAPLNLWGASAVSLPNQGGPTTTYNSAAYAAGAFGNRGDPYARAAAALNQRGSNVDFISGPPRHQHSNESLTESTFTLGNTQSHGKGAMMRIDRESPAFAAAIGAFDAPGPDDSNTELTPHTPSHGYMFGNRVNLPQFQPLLGSGEQTPPKKLLQPPQSPPPPAKADAAAATAAAASTTAEVTKADRNAKEWDVSVESAPLDQEQQQQQQQRKKDRQTSNSASGAGPLHRSVTRIGAAHVLLGGSSVEKDFDDENRKSSSGSDSAEVVDVDGAPPPRRDRHPRSGTHADPNRDITADGRSTHAEMTAIDRKARQDTKALQRNGDAAESVTDGVYSPLSSGSAQRLPTAAPAHHGISTSNGQFSSNDNDAPPPPGSSPLPVKPPLPLMPGARRRQPGTAVVPNPTLILHRGARFVKDEDSFFVTMLLHVRKTNLTWFSRLYAAQAHVKENGQNAHLYFANTGDSAVMRRCPYNPLTLYHIADAGGAREGLTMQEQRLLNFVYCRPESSSAVGAAGNRLAGITSNINNNNNMSDRTDLSSLAVKRGVAAVGAEDTTSPPASTPNRDGTSVFAEEVDAFILAMGLLPDRPMRLTFLPVHVEAVAPRLGMSGTFSASSASLSHRPGTPPPLLRSDAAAKESEEGGVTQSDAAAAAPPPPPLPPLKTLPVLECVVDDVLCVLTKMEVTVDAAFQKPSKILLVGVSLEDVSEGSERGVGDDEMDSLMDAKETRRPLSTAESSPTERRFGATALPHQFGSGVFSPSSTRVGYTSACTVGQEFREIIVMDRDAEESEASLTTM